MGGRGGAVGPTVTVSSSFTGFSVGVNSGERGGGRVGGLDRISSVAGRMRGGSDAPAGNLTFGKAVDGLHPVPGLYAEALNPILS